MMHHAGFLPLNGLRTRIAILAVCVLAGIALSCGQANAQDTSVAGLIVDYGDGRVSYALVPFEEDTINGLDLLDRSGLDVVSVGFGGLGDAVCQIDDTGCSVDDCRTRMCQTSDRESPFWQFSKLSDDGEWQMVATGASGAQIQDGDIYAWTWTGLAPQLPVLSMDELAERAGGPPDLTDGLQASLRTEGGETGSNEGGIETVSIVVVVAVVVVAGFLVLRARRPAGSSVFG
jgi:hypothetical protein